MLAQFVKTHKQSLEDVATGVRLLGMDAVLKAKSGHVGLPLGGAEMGTLLYFAAMHFDPQNSTWIDRDRFVLSAGHGSMLQYSLLHLSGYNLAKEELVNFRQLHSKTPGHPEYGHTEGIECTTGPLGQGLANAVGMALAERMLAARFHDNNESESIIDHRTFVLAGDGCMMEGVSAEACSLAGHLKLNRLIVLYDANNITIDGTIDISFSENVAKRFEAYGFNIFYADGNSFESLAENLDKAYEKSNLPNGETGPSLIVCKGIAGKGSPKWEGKPKIHGNPMSAEDVLEAKKHLGVDNLESFFVPQKCYDSAQKLVSLRTQKAKQWDKKLNEKKHHWEKTNPEKLKLWKDLFETEYANAFLENELLEAKGKMATRVSSGKALAQLAQHNPKLVGGSADLAGSNLTTIPNSSFVNARDFSGRNIHFGVREHGMGAICNGITLHGGLRGYCATFLVFSDYMRPAIRLAALMKIPTLFIFTHDSYGVGEDGPTHQPIEHADSLRIIPNLNVYRPADTLETYVAWQQALDSKIASALLLTRQDVPDLDENISIKRTFLNLSEQIKKGAYILKDFYNINDTSKKIILVASGSEVQIALQTAQKLEMSNHKLSVRVVSCPCPQVLVKNPLHLNTLVPKEYFTVAIEASSAQSFAEIVGRSGAIYGMKDFGASAPFHQLSQHFGFTEPQFSEFILNQLNLR
ncbi:MAG: transketolase [Bdellovibrionota bacterium]